MHGGWFIGDFQPSIVRTDMFEVAIKSYRAGHREPAHFHKISKEITVITAGEAKFNNRCVTVGQIVLIEPFEAVEFIAVTDVTTTVIKLPSVVGDKYLGVSGGMVGE
jgi:hypothetical protein